MAELPIDPKIQFSSFAPINDPMPIGSGLTISPLSPFMRFTIFSRSDNTAVNSMPRFSSFAPSNAPMPIGSGISFAAVYPLNDANSAESGVGYAVIS